MIDITEYETEIQDAWIAGPGGIRLYLNIRQPMRQKYPRMIFPAVFIVPGGLGSGAEMPFDFASRGYIQVRYCPPGRGKGTPEDPHSEGEENHNGFIGQDGLKAAIDYVAGMPEVDRTCIGLYSFSLGITLAVGVLGRYPELPISYLIDFEGPSDSEIICFEPWKGIDDTYIAKGYRNFGHYSLLRDKSPENIAWWREREAIHFIGQMRAFYMRIQAEEDHAQPAGVVRHALDLVNLATQGYSPWTRVNGSDLGNPINKVYDPKDPDSYPRFHPGHFPLDQGIEFLYLREMTELMKKGKYGTKI